MYAIAEFGSISRKESDKHSDRDLLIVCGKDKQSVLYERYSERGYSVSLLTPEQLVFMNRRGSLFIQHLKKESKILVDDNGHLARFLDSCELVPPSEDELSKCKGTVEFIRSWSGGVSLGAWRADFLYCVSRDYLIKKLAREGVIAFGLDDLERESCLHFEIQKTEFMNLRILRQAKAAYRSTRELPPSMNEATDAWLKTLSRTFNATIFNAHAVLIDENLHYLKTRKFNTPYEQLRSLEAVYLMARSRNLRHPDHDLLMKHILRPNLYGSSQYRKFGRIRKYLCEVIDLLVDDSLRAAHFPLRFASL